MVLKGLLFSLFTYALAAVVSLVVVGVISVIYRVVHKRKPAEKPAE